MLPLITHALVGALLLVAFPSEPSAAALPPAAQLRAYWVDAFGDDLNSEAKIAELVTATKAANMNAIVAQIVRRGDCFCLRAGLPRTEAPIAPAPFDPLDTLIARAHAEGIEVHAWVISTAIWRGTARPADPAHAFNLHGTGAVGAADWLTRRSDGVVGAEGDNWIIDPGHPDAADWMVEAALAIVRNYAVDGINLDRIRYPDDNLASQVGSWGYNPTALAYFQRATGRTDVPAANDAQWAQWRRDQVTNIVRRVYLGAYAIRPGVRVSADVITYGSGPSAVGWTRTRAYTEQLQDWRAWLEEGILDLAVPMNYKRDADASQHQMYDEWTAFAKDNQYRRQTAIGAALYLNEIGSSIRQVRASVAPSAAGYVAAGYVGYSYRTPDAQAYAGTRSGAASRALLVDALTRSAPDGLTPVFAAAAPIPEMPWKSRPTLGHVTGTATADLSVRLLDPAGATVRQTTADGAGWFGFVDVAPGTYRITSNRLSGDVSVRAGTVTAATLSAPQAETCTASEGPGIPPPATVPSGIGGFHAAWYGQSGYPTLCPGQRATAVVAFYNSGSLGWVSGKMGEVAYLGTWVPEPGQDQPSALGGDGTMGSPATGWPRYNRVAIQPAPYVGPGQIAWFQFTIQAPATPGTYRLAIRALVEGATWMEDYGVFWFVTVKARD